MHMHQSPTTYQMGSLDNVDLLGSGATSQADDSSHGTPGGAAEFSRFLIERASSSESFFSEESPSMSYFMPGEDGYDEYNSIINLSDHSLTNFSATPLTNDDMPIEDNIKRVQLPCSLHTPRKASAEYV